MEYTLDGRGKTLESRDDGIMKFIASPQRKKKEANTDADNITHEDCQETLTGNFQDLLGSAYTRHHHQIERQHEYHHPIIVSLLYPWNLSKISRCCP